MPDLAEPLARLIAELKRLPAIGAKSAQRVAFHLLRAGREDAERLAQAGIPERDLPTLTERAAAEPSASANPRKFDVAGALELYAATY
jgi:alcohol dehydrogenase class IV